MVGDKVQMQTLPTLFHGSGGCMGCDASTCACRRTPAKGTVIGEETYKDSRKMERLLSFSGRVRWFGVDEMYFFLGIALGEKDDSACTLSGMKDSESPKNGILAARVVLPRRELRTRDPW